LPLLHFLQPISFTSKPLETFLTSAQVATLQKPWREKVKRMKLEIGGE
jgi:hypothetical protein